MEVSHTRRKPLERRRVERRGTQRVNSHIQCTGKMLITCRGIWGSAAANDHVLVHKMTVFFVTHALNFPFIIRNFTWHAPDHRTWPRFMRHCDFAWFLRAVGSKLLAGAFACLKVQKMTVFCNACSKFSIHHTKVHVTCTGSSDMATFYASLWFCVVSSCRGI